MESLLSWLHAEREVMKRAPWLVAMVATAGLALGGAGAAFLYDRQYRDAQQAVITAQAQRDFWKDKFDDLEKRGTAAENRRVEPAPKPAVGWEISWPRTGVLLASIALVLLAILLFAPIPRWKRAAVQPPEPKKTISRPVPLEPMEPLPPPVGLMTAPRALQAPPPFTPPAGAMADPSKISEMPRHLRAFLYARPEEQVAMRPHLKIAWVKSEVSGPADRRNGVTALAAIKNETNSAMESCSVVVESVIRGGLETKVEQATRHGRARSPTFQMAPGEVKTIALVYRKVNVAPEKPFSLALIEDVVLEDNSTYEINVRLESNTGVLTRAVVDVVLGEYEDLAISLVGQSSSRR